MKEQDYAKLVAKNLKRIAYDHDKTQADIAKDLGLNKQTVSSWFRGERIPRMSKIDMLCEYFDVRRSDIMEDEAARLENHTNTFNEKFHIKFMLSDDEYDIINKYRVLDDHGIDMTKTVIEKEYNRCAAMQANGIPAWVPEPEKYKFSREEFERTIREGSEDMAARNGKNKK